MRSSPLLTRKLALALTVGLALAVTLKLAGGPGETSAAPSPKKASRPRLQTTAAPARRALLVGIDRYAPNTDKRFARLEGAVRDVELVKGTLTADFGFDADDIKTLTNAEATHENIDRAFEEFLVRPAGANTEVLFWFSGHGSRIRDESGRAGAELDGRDSTLLAYDSRPEGGQRVLDISDDELHSLIQRVAKKTDRITIVTDACHSGGGTRGALTGRIGRVRSGPEASVPLDRERIAGFLPSDFEFLDDNGLRPDIASRYVHISACTERQLAREYVVKVANGERIVHGALTYFLIQALRAASPGDSYGQVLRHAALLVSTYIPGQTAVIEGAVDRKLFSGNFIQRPRGYPAQFADGRIVIQAGTLHGLRKGSVVEVDDYKGNSLCKAEVKLAGPDTAFARITGEATTKPQAEVPLLVHEVERPSSVARLSVKARTPELRKRLEAPEASVWARFDANGEYELAIADAGQPSLVSPDGFHALCKLDDGQAGEPLDVVLRKELRYQQLRKLASEQSGFELTARFVQSNQQEIAAGTDFTDKLVPASIEQVTGRGSAVAPVWRGELLPYPDDKPEGQRVGELITIEVTNKSSKELYLGVLSLSQTREINAICPELGCSKLLPPHGTTRVRVWVGAESQADWPDAAGPLTERYVIVGTTVFINYDSFQQGRIENNRGPGLPPILKAAIEQPVTRGRKISTTDRRFGVTWLDLLIDRRDH